MKKQLLSLLLMMLPLVASASVEIDGIFYNLNAEDQTAEVTHGKKKYLGDIVIPILISYENTEYSVTSIGEKAFYGCKGLASVTIPNSVTSIEECAFSYCEGLTSISIPNSVTSIKYSAFFGCTGLTSLNIPNSLTRIEYSAFQACSGLTSVTIPNSVTTIEQAAFANCSSLTSITIPNSVTNVKSWAFQNCSGLTSVTIGKKVRNIGMFTFAGCSSLTSVTSLSPTPPAIDSDTFKSYTPVLRVPTESKEAYQTADYWKNFTNIEEIDVTGVQGIRVDKQQNAMVYDLQGHQLTQPKKGLNIIKMSDGTTKKVVIK